MEVTKSNFKDVLLELQKAIDNSLFLSIDCEMTGLYMTNNISAFDTPAVYYKKTRQNSQNFLLIQFGLSLFRYDPKQDIFKHKSFNFYIFRQPIDRLLPDQRFVCQSSSINFLINQGFDFNKLFKNGISYLNNYEEQYWKNVIEERRKNKTNNTQNYGSSIPIPENYESTIENVVDQLEKFLETEEDDVQLSKYSAFVRKLIYQTVAEKFPGRISLETRQVENDRILYAFRSRTKDEEEEIEKKRYEESCQALTDFKGFSQVIKMIQESEKLIVGHNMLLDLLHTIDKFVTPLEDDYNDFKQIVQFLFPKIVDTKYMASTKCFKDLIQSTVLGNVVETISKSPFELPKIEGDDSYSYSLNDNKAHEAGYDAFITGVSFIAMWKHLGSLENKTSKETFKDFSLLTDYNILNRIYVMILTDDQYINIQGEDLNPSRDHVFYLNFPKDWKNHNLTELFNPFGNIYISWINDTSAYVGLYKRDQADVVLSTLSQSDTYSIMPFNKHKEIQNKIPSVPVKRKFSGESSTEFVKRRRTEGSDNKTLVKPTADPDVSKDNDDQWKTVTRKGKRKLAKTFAQDDKWD